MICALDLGAQASELVLGREDAWSDLYSVAGVRLEPGRWGHLDLVLDDRIDASDADLWIGFDRDQAVSGHYRMLTTSLDRETFERTGAEFVRGGSSGVFGGAATLSLLPTSDALLAPGQLSSDFSVQFWMYPATLRDGEELLSWSGSVALAGDNETGSAQTLSVTFENRRVRWRFEGLFRGANQGDAATSVELLGLTPLVPRRWRHHLLRFDSTYGTLEYLIDGKPHAITHVTSTRTEGGSTRQPWVGSGRAASLQVGRSFVGLMDDLQITTNVAIPQLTRFANASGWAATRVYDLGHPETSLEAIDISSDNAGSDAEIFFYYRISDRPFSPEIGFGTQPVAPVPVQLEPNLGLSQPPSGRYLQLMFELLPSGTRAVSPRLHEVRIRYLAVAPPPPPARLIATPGNAAVRLAWQPATHYDVRESDIGGYLVYYGTEPGRYLAGGQLPRVDQGPSPVDVGRATSVILTGLTNGQVYYFSVVSYDMYDPPQQSSFIQEVVARPATIRRLP